MVYLLLGDGFEEMEALAPIDLLRRAGIAISSVSLYDDRLTVTGGHGVVFTADVTIRQIANEIPDMVILPGGLGGVKEISASKEALELVQRTFEQNRYVAAICAAPTILQSMGILNGRKATCYPSMQKDLGDSLCPAPLCVDGKLVTAQAAGTAMDFALLLIEFLSGKEKADQVAASIYHIR